MKKHILVMIMTALVFNTPLRAAPSSKDIYEAQVTKIRLLTQDIKAIADELHARGMLDELGQSDRVILQQLWIGASFIVPLLSINGWLDARAVNAYIRKVSVKSLFGLIFVAGVLSAQQSLNYKNRLKFYTLEELKEELEIKQKLLTIELQVGKK